jgi:GAF domain-containing protein
VTAVSTERLARVFVEVADTLVDEFEIVDFLHRLALRTAELVDAAAVGLLLTDQRGRLQFMAASQERVKLLELFQLQNDEGPCLDAFRTATPVVNADLRQAGGRWPRFAPRATEAGFRSVHAFPLRLRSEVIGALNIFGTDADARLDEEDINIVQAIADIATIALLQERSARRSEILTEQLQAALNSRITIEQAKGVLSQALDLSIDEAFNAMRAYARHNNLRLGDLAHTVVTDLASLPGLAHS